MYMHVGQGRGRVRWRGTKEGRRMGGGGTERRKEGEWTEGVGKMGGMKIGKERMR